MFVKLYRDTEFHPLPAECSGLPCMAVVCFEGDCEVSASGAVHTLPPCHAIVLSTAGLEGFRGGREPVLAFHVTELETVGVVQETPLLVDEISMAVLADVFVEHARTPAHEQAALAFATHQLADNGRPGRPGDSETALAEAVEAYLREHLDEPVTLEELASTFHCSRIHLSRQMRSGGKASPMRRLAELRMQKARQLLRQTSLTVSQTAIQVGMPDLAAFSHFFKKHSGQSPSEFRENVNWLL